LPITETELKLIAALSPFLLQPVEEDIYEIRGNDGLICTVFGERNAKRILRMIEWFSKNETAPVS